MSKTLEDLAVAIVSASEIAIALKIPFKFEVDFPEIAYEDVEPLDIYWGQVRSQRLDLKSGKLRLVVRVHTEDWDVVIPPELYPDVFNNMPYTGKSAAQLSFNLRKIITTHVLENS